jgi:iron complex outermembrane receptor protein
MMTPFRLRHHALFVALAGFMSAATAEAAPQAPEQNLAEVSIEDLMQVRVTTASRRAQRAEDVAAAVFVITREDIRRSGLTTLPELLRLAPGVQVARVSASKWAVSIRGFNDLFANKLLVLIDGRSVYTRAFGGVLWDAQDLLIGDIDRIEVIRGPGGAMWGANAVNGVINVITRNAADTQGWSVDLSAGTLERERAGLRYGGSAGTLKYRLFSQWSGYSDTQNAAGGPGDDSWHSLLTGARIDLSRGANTAMAQAHYIGGRSRPRYVEYAPDRPGNVSLDGIAQTREFTLLGRWMRTFSAGGLATVQGSHTNGHRRELNDWQEYSTELDAQYELAAAGRHAIVVGGAFREVQLTSSDSLTLRLGSEHTRILSAFIHDDIALPGNVSLSLGGKTEHDGVAGWGVSPSARVLWRPAPTQRIWAAVSRARRTPSATDRALTFVTPVQVAGMTILGGYVGNPDYRHETLVEAELGYRLRFGAAAVEAALFQGAYRELPTSEPVGPVFVPTPAPGFVMFANQSANLMSARTRGAEVNASWTPARVWRLTGSYSFLALTPRPDPTSRDTHALLVDGHAPRHQWQVHSLATLTPRLEFDLGVYHAGRLAVLAVPAYTRLDVRVEYKLSERLALVGLGRNLVDARHPEFSGARSAFVASTIPRSGHLMLRWGF